MLSTRLALGRRSALMSLAGALLLGACGSGGGGNEAEAPTTTAETTTTVAPAEFFGGDLCKALDPADLSAVTNEDFDDGTNGESSCTYTSTKGSAIAITVSDASAVPVAAAIEGATSRCDDGTVAELTFDGSSGAFSCQVEGIASVAAIGSGALVVLTGATTDPSIDVDGVIAALVQVLENAIAGGGGES